MTEPSTLEPQETLSTNLRRVLRALRARRALGWHLPAHFLELSYDTVEVDGARLDMPVGPHCLDRRGSVHRAAVMVLADVAMAGALRGRFGAGVRLATVNIRLNLTDAHAVERLCATASCVLDMTGSAVPLTVCSVRIESGGILLCSGEATFMVMENRSGAPAHPLPRTSTLEGSEPLRLAELTAEERDAFDHAQRADGLARQGAPFLDAYWSLLPRVTDSRADCDFVRGIHVSNRVGDVQGGVLLGLATETAAALMPDGWRVIDCSARYLAAADAGQMLHATAATVRAGRNLTFVECAVADPAGRVSVRAEVTLARTAAPA